MLSPKLMLSLSWQKSLSKQITLDTSLYATEFTITEK